MQLQVSTPRFVGLAALSGLIAGVGMAMWQMIYTAATGSGFFSPLNVCMASFVYRADAQMMIHDMMMHPGSAAMMMDAPVQPSHLAVGAGLHLAFSAIVGVIFAFALLLLAQLSRSAVLQSQIGFVVASMAGAAVLFLVMIYLVLPWANPLIVDMTPRGAFFIGHLIYGAIFGLVAFRLLRPAFTVSSGAALKTA